MVYCPSKKQEVPKRVSLAFIVASGIILIYISRVAMSVAIVAMVTITGSNKTNNEPFCIRMDQITIARNGTESKLTDQLVYKLEENGDTSASDVSTSVLFLTTTQRGFILGAFFYGYVSTAIIGGLTADKIGTKKVFALAVFLEGTSNFFVPLAAKTHFIALIALQFFIGLCQGVCYPSIASMITRWIPPEERARFMSFTFVANSFGTILSFSVSGLVIAAYGWEVIFYLIGGIFYSWLFFWWFLMYDSPDDHPRISIQEKQYIQLALAASVRNKRKSVPWKSMFLSVPLWATTLAHCGSMYGLHFLITQLPIYFSSIIGLAIRQNAALSAIPFLARFLGANTWSWIDAYILKKNYFTRINHRKFFNTFALFGPAVIFVIVAYVDCSPYITLALFALALFISGATMPGYVVNWLDIAPNFGGTVQGISNTVAFAFTTLAPIIAGALTPDETMDQWRTVFWVTSIIYLAAGTCFLILATDKNQDWNYEIEPKKNQKELENSPS